MSEEQQSEPLTSDDFYENEPQEEVIEDSEIEEDAEAGEETEEAEESEGQDAEEEEGESLDLEDVAQYFGVEPDKLDVIDGEVVFKTNIDGVEGHAKPADILKSYQLEGHLNKQNMEVVEAKKALQTQQVKQQEEFSSKLQQLDDIAGIAVKYLNEDYQAINWAELRDDDPGEYAAKQAEFQQRQAKLGQLFQQVNAEREKANKDMVKTHEERSKEILAKEQAKTLEVFPEWKDPQRASQARKDLASFAASAGFTEKEINDVVDHRILIILDKAMKYDSLAKESVKVTKKVRKTPKVAKPGNSNAPPKTASFADAFYGAK